MWIVITSGTCRRLAATAMPAVICREFPENHLSWEGWMYQAPKLERLGTFREVTLAGGMVEAGDGANPYHRYSA
jgi:hypothetical protein